MCADSWDWEGLNAFRLDVGARAASPHQQRLEQQQRIQNARAAKPSNFRQESHYKSNQGQFSSNSNGVSFGLAVHGTLDCRTFMEAFEIDNSAKPGTLTQLPWFACRLLMLDTDAGKAHLSRSRVVILCLQFLIWQSNALSCDFVSAVSNVRKCYDNSFTLLRVHVLVDLLAISHIVYSLISCVHAVSPPARGASPV